jgi:hypothetical protein
MRWLAAVVVMQVVAGAAGCAAAHVQLDPPPLASAAEETRRDYYEAHRPEKPKRGELVLRTRLGTDTPTVSQTSFRLKNGARLTAIEDLLPLVDDHSPTAAAIAASVDARDRARLLFVAGVGVGGLGLAAGAGLLATYVAFAPPGEVNRIDPLAVAGIATAAVGGLAGASLLAWGTVVSDAEDDLRMKAWRSYDDDLRARLGLAPAPLQ